VPQGLEHFPGAPLIAGQEHTTPAAPSSSTASVSADLDTAVTPSLVCQEVVGLPGQEVVALPIQLPHQDQENIVCNVLPAAPEKPNKSNSRLKVTIRRWNGVAVWKWLANDDTCGICRFPFHGCCPDCKYAGDDCPLVWGQCTHCFHIHCIMKWLGTPQQQCPMCRQEWKFKEKE